MLKEPMAEARAVFCWDVAGSSIYRTDPAASRSKHLLSLFKFLAQKPNTRNADAKGAAVQRLLRADLNAKLAYWVPPVHVPPFLQCCSA